jgi:hypothetical protein
MDFPLLPPLVCLLCVEQGLSAAAQPRSRAVAGVRVSGDERPRAALCTLHKTIAFRAGLVPQLESARGRGHAGYDGGPRQSARPAYSSARQSAAQRRQSRRARRSGLPLRPILAARRARSDEPRGPSASAAPFRKTRTKRGTPRRVARRRTTSAPCRARHLHARSPGPRPGLPAHPETLKVTVAIGWPCR